MPVVVRPEVDHWYDHLGNPYEPSFVPPAGFANSARIGELIRAGNLYLSLRDAIALSLENNLDLEFQRFTPLISDTEVKRAKGGGVLRGLPIAATEAPVGIGGPGAPLLNVAASGGAPNTGGSLITAVSDTLPLAGGTTNLSILSGTVSTGTLVPLFDPALTGQLNWLHQETAQTNPLIAGSTALLNENTTGIIGYNQGFSTGTSFQVATNTVRTSSNSIRLVYNPYTSSTATLNIIQPLFRGFGTSLNRRFIRIAKNEQALAGVTFRQQVISTVSGVVRLYWDLVSLNEDLQVKRQTLALAQKLYEDNRAQVEAGTLAPLELTRAQAYVAAAQQDVANAEGYVAQQELILKSVLTRRLNDEPALTGAHIVPTDPITIPTTEQVRPVQDLVNEAFRQRPELEAARLQIENTNIGLEGSRNFLKPAIDLVGTVGGSGLAGQPNPLIQSTNVGGTVVPATTPTTGLGGTWDSLGQLLGGRYPTYGIGVQVTLPLRNRVAQADYERDLITLRQAEVRRQQLDNQVRLEIENALVVLHRSRASLEAATQSRVLQEQSLEAEQKKFAVGLSTVYMILQYQSFVAQARSTEAAARGTYVKAQNALDRATGEILDRWGVELDEALRGQVTRRPDSLPAVPPATGTAAPAPAAAPSR